MLDANKTYYLANSTGEIKDVVGTDPTWHPR